MVVTSGNAAASGGPPGARPRLGLGASLASIVHGRGGSAPTCNLQDHPIQVGGGVCCLGAVRVGVWFSIPVFILGGGGVDVFVRVSLSVMESMYDTRRAATESLPLPLFVVVHVVGFSAACRCSCRSGSA